MGQRQTLSTGQLLSRPTFGDTRNTMSACFLFVCLIFFSGKCSVCLFTPHKEPVRKLALRVFPKGRNNFCHNDVMPNTGIEPATLRSLSQRSNQLSYAVSHLWVCDSSREKWNYFLSHCKEHAKHATAHLCIKAISSAGKTLNPAGRNCHMFQWLKSCRVICVCDQSQVIL